MLSCLKAYLLYIDTSAYSLRHHPQVTHAARLTSGTPSCPSSIAPIGQTSVSKLSGRLENRKTGGAPNAVRAGGLCQNPVSYTHLRAHETRHDIVCRLLL